ncbi:MAG: GvpL/GvpF family gas vesicle protein [Nitrospinota bacterium]
MDEGKYIYCIIDDVKGQTLHCNPAESFGPIGIGGRGDELYTICFQDIGAVVSNSPIKKYSVSRENCLSHEKAIEEVMKYHTVLPVRFCTIAGDEEKVKQILEKEYHKFKTLLRDISGKKELGLKAVFIEDIYTDILTHYDDIRTIKEEITLKSPETTHYLRIEIGKKVEIALEKEKAKYRKEILMILEPLAEEVKINKSIGERMLLNAAFLVKELQEKEFDEKVRDLDDRCSDKVKFKYVSNLPPFNFINLIINAGEY